MAVPKITIYSGDFPNRNDPQTKFSNDVGNFLPYFNSVGPEYNILGDWVNDQVIYIDSAILDGQTAIDNSVAEAAQSAVDAENSAELSNANANFKGYWSNLTGSLNIPAAVSHNGKSWQLVANLADVALSEPGVSADWLEIKFTPETIQVSGNFTAEAGAVYIASTADITMPVIEAGQGFEFHAITDNVRVLNPSYTITNGTRSINAGDDLLLKNGQTVKLTVLDATTLEVI